MNRHMNRQSKIEVEDREPVLLNMALSALLGLAVAVACLLAYEVGPFLR
jgi:hypothetical protein